MSEGEVGGTSLKALRQEGPITTRSKSCWGSQQQDYFTLCQPLVLISVEG